MILVDDAGEEWPMIGHAPWNGCNLADFAMPFFLFIVGMAIALALKVQLLLIFVLDDKLLEDDLTVFIIPGLVLFIENTKSTYGHWKDHP